jgi:hypothetical protein
MAEAELSLSSTVSEASRSFSSTVNSWYDLCSFTYVWQKQRLHTCLIAGRPKILAPCLDVYCVATRATCMHAVPQLTCRPRPCGDSSMKKYRSR